MHVEGQAYQISLSEVELPKIYNFRVGTVIYWLSGGTMGAIQGPLTACRLPVKAKRLHVFEARNTVITYYDQHYYTLPTGKKFLAYTPKKY